MKEEADENARLIWLEEGSRRSCFWRFHAPGEIDIRTWCITLVGRKIQVEKGPLSGPKEMVLLEKETEDEAWDLCTRWREEKREDGWREVAEEIRDEVNGYSGWGIGPRRGDFADFEPPQELVDATEFIHAPNGLDSIDPNLLLEIAIERFDRSLLHRSIERGADVNYCPDLVHDWAPLDLALGCGNHYAVRVLKEQGAEYTPEPSDELVLSWELAEALLEASESADEEEVQWLLEQGALPLPDHWHQSYPLEEAALTGNLNIVRMLLKAGADPNLHDGIPPIVGAAGQGSSEMVGLLIEKGCDLNAVDEFGDTALTAAVQRDDDSEAAQIFSQLLQKGADPNKTERLERILSTPGREKLKEKLRQLLKIQGPT